jgi:hypothetical protein
VSQTQERAAPQGAERWFYAPRNPNIPAPGKREILAGPAGPGGDGVSVHRGAALSPTADSLIARGGLFMYQGGVLFLPLAPAEAKSWLEEMRPAAEIAIMVGMAFLPLGHEYFDVAREYALHEAIIEALFGKEEERAKRQLAARWEHPGVVVIPLVNVIEASYGSVRGHGLLAKRTGYLAVAVQEAGGQEVGYTFSLPTSGEAMPGALFTARMARELEVYAARAGRTVTGYDERARAGLAKLGLDVTAPEVTWDSIREAVERERNAGRASRLDQVTLGQLVDTLNQVGETAWNDAKQRLGDPTREMSRLIVEYLEPMLPYYRRVPAMAHTIEVVERVAAGETNRDWTPAWRPEAHRFNFAPGEYPPSGP